MNSRPGRCNFCAFSQHYGCGGENAIVEIVRKRSLKLM